MNTSVERRFASEWFKKVGYIGLWYLGIYALVFVILLVSMWFFNKDYDWSDYLFQPAATSILFFVVGIVLPLIYTEPYIAMGISRRQLFRGTIMSIATLSFIGACLHAAVNLILVLSGHPFIAQNDILLQLPVDFISFVFYYLIGWCVALGFIYAKKWTAVLAVLFGIVSVNVSMQLIAEPLFIIGATPLLPPLACIGIVLLIGVIAFIIVARATKQQPVKA